jgi:hypothetical protein
MGYVAICCKWFDRSGCSNPEIKRTAFMRRIFGNPQCRLVPHWMSECEFQDELPRPSPPLMPVKTGAVKVRK